MLAPRHGAGMLQPPLPPDPPPTTPGWYADPAQPGLWRYYDGSAWTDHTATTPPRQGALSPAPQDQARTISGIVGIVGLAFFTSNWALFVLINLSAGIRAQAYPFWVINALAGIMLAVTWIKVLRRLLRPHRPRR